MYISVSTLTKLPIGTLIVLEKDQEFCEIAAKDENGSIIGFAMHDQPQGCLSYAGALRDIEGRQVKGRIVLTASDIAVLLCSATVSIDNQMIYKPTWA